MQEYVLRLKVIKILTLYLKFKIFNLYVSAIGGGFDLRNL